MAASAEKLPPPEEDPPKKPEKRSHNWGKIGAVATIVGTLAAIGALYPIVFKPAEHPAISEQHRMFDGPIARIATQERGWDKRGFEPSDMDSMASEIMYRFAGHFTDPVNGDHNPHNEMCAIKLRANPSTTPPLYPGDSGFVYIQPGTTKIAQGTVLHNPTLPQIYDTQRRYDEFVEAKCWPGSTDMPLQFPHTFDEYR